MRSCARRGETRAWDKGPQHSWHVSDRPAPARAPCERIARGDLIIVVTGYCVASELYHQEQKTSRCGIDTVCASLSSLDSIARWATLSQSLVCTPPRTAHAALSDCTTLVTVTYVTRTLLSGLVEFALPHSSVSPLGVGREGRAQTAPQWPRCRSDGESRKLLKP